MAPLLSCNRRQRISLYHALAAHKISRGGHHPLKAQTSSQDTLSTAAVIRMAYRGSPALNLSALLVAPGNLPFLARLQRCMPPRDCCLNAAYVACKLLALHVGCWATVS